MKTIDDKMAIKLIYFMSIPKMIGSAYSAVYQNKSHILMYW